MKKFTDIVTIAIFYTMIAMFAVSSVIFNIPELVSRISSSPDPRTGAVGFIRNDFPLTGDLKSMYAGVMQASGRTRFGNICLTDERLIRLSDPYDQSRIDENVSRINSFAEGTSVPMWLMLAPTAWGIYSEELSPYITGNAQKETINSIYMSLDKSIGAIDVYYSIYSAHDEYVYYRSSDLWTSFGAYCAYIESMKQLGSAPQTLANYDQEYAYDRFRGELFDLVRYTGLEPDRINIFRSKYQSPVEKVILRNGDDVREAKSVYFKSALKTSKKTDLYLMGDKYEQVDIYTSNQDLPKLLIIKGSYANTLIPFYTAHYSLITVVDPKKLDSEGKTLEDLVDPDGYDHILIMTDIDSFAEADYYNVLPAAPQETAEDGTDVLD